MVIDTSALVALLENELYASLLSGAISLDPVRLMSSVSVLEETCVLGSRRGPAAVAELNLFFPEFRFEQILLFAQTDITSVTLA